MSNTKVNSRLDNKVLVTVNEELTKLAGDPKSDLQKKDVPDILAKLQPILEYATNNDDWYRSRAFWGAIFGLVSFLSVPFGYAFDVEQYTNIATAGAGLASAGFILYNRYFARAKPIGS